MRADPNDRIVLSDPRSDPLRQPGGDQRWRLFRNVMIVVALNALGWPAFLIARDILF